MCCAWGYRFFFLCILYMFLRKRRRRALCFQRSFLVGVHGFGNLIGRHCGNADNFVL